MKKSLALAGSLLAVHLAAAPLAVYKGDLSDKLPGWEFKPSKPKNGLTYNEFEGYYPDKGGKLSSNLIKLDKAPGEGAYYRLKFDAAAPERAYQGVDFFDAEGKLLPDNYDVIYPGERRAYERVIYAMPKADSIRVFFQSTSGIRAWDLSVEKVDAAAAQKYCDDLYATLPPLKFQAPADAMKLLPRTAEALKTGKPWHVVMLGDSIMQDAFHSQFHSLLKREFPKSNCQFTISMRGGTGCWLYCQPEEFKKYVLNEKPDLLIIGGISNYNKSANPTGTEAMEIVVREAKKQLGCEVLLLSGALSVDSRKHDDKNPGQPLPAQVWSYEQDGHVQSCYKPQELAEMAARQGVAVWDLATPTYTWLYASGKPYQWFSRDYVHSGERGKQVIGRTLVEYFKTAK